MKVCQLEERLQIELDEKDQRMEAMEFINEGEICNLNNGILINTIIIRFQVTFKGPIICN